ncbi:MAG: hypothetical protein WCN97_05085 [Thermoleophilia bacterium]
MSRHPTAIKRMPIRLSLALLLGAVLLAVVGVGTAAATVTVRWAPTDLHPQAIAMDSAGNLYTANKYGASVTKITPAGDSGASPYVWSFADDYVSAIAVDAAGFVYTANGLSDTVSRINPANPTLTWPNRWARLALGSVPAAIAIDASGNVYTANSGNATVSKIAPDGTVTAAFGTTGSNPQAIVLDAAGNIYTANYDDNTVSKITANGQSTPAWAHLVSGCDPGSCPAWDSVGPAGIAIDPAGNLFVAGYVHGDVLKVTPDGTVSLLAHDPTLGLWGITIDSAGNLYAAVNDSPTSTTHSSVAQITPDGHITVLGDTGQGSTGIVLDAAGSLFTANASADSVSKITSGGGTPTIAPAPAARPAAPVAVAGAGSATITVTPNPTSALYGAPTSYIVQAAGDASKTCTVTVPATSCTISGLTAGTAYRFVAIAAVGSGRTAASDPSNAVTPAAAATPAAAPVAAAAATPAAAPVAKVPVSFGANAARVPAAQAATGLAVSSSGTVLLPLTCPVASFGGCDAAGDLSISLPGSVRAAHVKVIARFKGVEITAGGRKLVTLHLDPATYERLRAAGIRRVRATLHTTTKLADGRSVSGNQRVWLKLSAPVPVPAVTG